MSESVGESFNQVVRGLGDFELDADCPTIEHQALKDAVRGGGVRSYSLENFLEKDTINIFTKDGGRLAMRYLADYSVGRLYLTESHQLIAVRGSFLIDPKQPPIDSIGHSMVRGLFDVADTADDEFVVSSYSSIPVVAASNVVIEGGYLAYHTVYTEEQHRDRLALNGDINAALFTYTSPFHVRIFGKDMGFFHEDEIGWSHSPVTEIGAGRRKATS